MQLVATETKVTTVSLWEKHLPLIWRHWKFISNVCCIQFRAALIYNRMTLHEDNHFWRHKEPKSTVGVVLKMKCDSLILYLTFWRFQSGWNCFSYLKIFCVIVLCVIRLWIVLKTVKTKIAPDSLIILHLYFTCMHIKKGGKCVVSVIKTTIPEYASIILTGMLEFNLWFSFSAVTACWPSRIRCPDKITCEMNDVTYDHFSR